jgi:hypothetical protein
MEEGEWPEGYTFIGGFTDEESGFSMSSMPVLDTQEEPLSDEERRAKLYKAFHDRGLRIVK